jgi:carbonic anhydrase
MTVQAPLLRLALLSLLLATTSAAASGPSGEACQGDDCCICDHGGSQSPINIVNPTRTQLPRLTFRYNQLSLADVVASVTKKRIDVIFVGARPTLTIGDETVVLRELHFHRPGEHKIGGAAAEMEMHLVHENQAGELTAVAVRMKPIAGRPNPLITELWDKAGSQPTRIQIRTSDLLPPPSGQGYYRYAGSLTTPPCGEGVRWHVLRGELIVSPEQINAYPFPNTARPVQPLNGRPVLESQ